MITLPGTPGTRDVSLRPVDFGIVQRPSTGAAITRIDRPGMRYAAEISWPPMDPDTARVFVSRLQRAVSQGLRVTFPLLRVSQAAAGSPTVNGSGAAGTSLPVTGGGASATIKEGWWLNVVDAGGVKYLHQVAADVTLNGSGAGTLSIWPPLRTALASGSAVTFAAPVIEGVLAEPPVLPRPVNGLVTLSVSIEEAA